MQPLVSVLILTYNHEKYICQAVESALTQKTRFPTEIIIAEDGSTDRTKHILEPYQSRPNTKLLLAPKNRGVSTNFLNALRYCKGKYIALLEGDDYWTSKKKLYKQVRFLERNPKYSGCFHTSTIVDAKDEVISQKYFSSKQREFTQSDTIHRLYSAYPTCSLVYKASCTTWTPGWFKHHVTDEALDILLTEHGPLRYLPKNWAAYRIHSEGWWQGRTRSQQNQEIIKRLRLFLEDPVLNARYSKQFHQRIKQCKANDDYH